MPIPRILIALLLSAGLTASAVATPTDFNFKDVELTEIFHTIAVLGRFNVVVDPQVARAKMNISLKQVEPLDALFVVAKIQELGVRRVKWEEGSTTVTYAIARRMKLESSFESAYGRTVQLKYARAADVAALIEAKLPKSANLSVNHDARTNKLLLQGPEDELAKVQTLLRDVDLPIPAMNAKLTVLAGPADKPAPIWSGTALAVQGMPAKVQLALTGTKPTPGWRLTKLSGDVLQRVNADDFCTVTVVVDVTLADKSGAIAELKLVGEAQVKDGEDTLVTSVEVAPGEVVQLKVRPDVVKATIVAPPPPEKEPAEPKPATDPLRKSEDVDLEGL